MKHYTEVMKKVKMIDGVVCDKCGKRITMDDIVEYNEMFTYSFIGGYGSVFGDGIEMEIDLCQSCFKEVLGKYLKKVEDWG